LKWQKHAKHIQQLGASDNVLSPGQSRLIPGYTYVFVSHQEGRFPCIMESHGI